MIENLDLTGNKVCGIDLETLESSITEKYPNGTPVGGIEHFMAIHRIFSMATDCNLNPEVTDIFVTNNRDRYRPGITLDINMAHQFGDTSPKAMMFRRVYCNMLLMGAEGEEWRMCLALSYSQKGITIGLGAHVHYCRNLCLLGAESVYSNYGVALKDMGDNLIKDTEEMLSEVGNQLSQLTSYKKRFTEFLERAQNRAFGFEDYYNVISRFTEERIRHDSDEPLIHKSEIYPLNQTQINKAAEKLLIEIETARHENSRVTCWDAYNILNFDLKPNFSESPNVIPQSAKLFDVFNEVVK